MTECAKCGDCCERISTKPHAWERQAIVLMANALPYAPKVNWKGDREGLVEDAAFITAHWTRLETAEDTNGTDHWVCDMWDRETRLCKAHDSRPPVCRGYPWYGEQPNEERGRVLSKRCSFIRDLPQEQWPEGADPL